MHAQQQPPAAVGSPAPADAVALPWAPARTLEAARIERGWDIATAARVTALSAALVRALEQGRPEAFHSPRLARQAALRYAHCLGVTLETAGGFPLIEHPHHDRALDRILEGVLDRARWTRGSSETARSTRIAVFLALMAAAMAAAYAYLSANHWVTLSNALINGMPADRGSALGTAKRVTPRALDLDVPNRPSTPTLGAKPVGTYSALP